MSKINLTYVSFDTIREYGQMNTNKSFYPEDLTPADRKLIMQTNKNKIANELGLSYKDIFIPIQKNMNNSDKYEDGKCYTLKQEDKETYDDLYDYDVYTDIVKLTKDTPNTIVAFPAADCAVIKAVNLKTNEAVLAHCGGEYIDRYLPMQTIDALGGNEKDIKVYISPFAHEMFYENIDNLKWANNQNVWQSFINEEEKNGIISARVDVKKALLKQLVDRQIDEENIILSPYNTAVDNEFYSNSRGYQDKTFAGRFLSGIALTDYQNIDEKPYIKIMK